MVTGQADCLNLCDENNKLFAIIPKEEGNNDAIATFKEVGAIQKLEPCLAPLIKDDNSDSWNYTYGFVEYHLTLAKNSSKLIQFDKSHNEIVDERFQGVNLIKDKDGSIKAVIWDGRIFDCQEKIESS